MNIKPMHAMSLDYYLKRAVDEYGFSKVSDKVRDQLKEQGMEDAMAAKEAPVMVDGLLRAHNGELDFKRIRNALAQEAARPNPGWNLQFT